MVDLETGGFSKQDNPILEVACSFVTMRDGELCVKDSASWSLEPFEGSHIEPASLKVTGIDLDDPNRNALDEREASRSSNALRFGSSKSIPVTFRLAGSICEPSKGSRLQLALSFTQSSPSRIVTKEQATSRIGLSCLLNPPVSKSTTTGR